MGVLHAGICIEGAAYIYVENWVGRNVPVSTRLMMGSSRIDPRAGTARPMMSLSY